MRTRFLPLVLALAACAPDEDGDGFKGDDDCDDADASAHIGATEVCDGADNDCDGDVDEPDASDALTFYADTDGDDFGDPDASTPGCTAPSGYVADNTDCDDASDASHPGATEVCDGEDNDCNGTVDDDPSDGSTFYADTDDDAFGDPANTINACSAPAGYVSDDTDCDDTDPRRFPGNTDLPYDGVDQDCDGADLCDVDEDGYDAAQGSCGGPDCNDNDSNVRPGLPEIYYDGIDRNCDGKSDYDADEDGYDSSDYEGDDCDDTDDTVNPAATEVYNLVDDNCDTQCDEGFISVGDLVITELMYDPSAVADGSGEWFEVYNASRNDIRLCGGWVLSDADSDSHTFTGDLTIAAGDHAVFGNNDDSTTNGGVTEDYDYGTSFFLANSNDELYLTFDSTVIDGVEWNFSDAAWSSLKAAGHSVQLDPSYYDATDNDSGYNWCTSYTTFGDGDYGTPGDTNDYCFVSS